MSDDFSDCSSCGSTITEGEDSGIISNDSGYTVTQSPSNPPMAGQVPYTTVINENTSGCCKAPCSSIEDQCSTCPVTPAPYTKLTLCKNTAMPDCGTSNAIHMQFTEDVSNIAAGTALYAKEINDTETKIVRLEVLRVNSVHTLVVYNPCDSSCESSKAVGEAIIANTEFVLGISPCSSTSTTSSSSSTSSCLVGTFHFPESGASSPANVDNSYDFNIGSLYSLAGFIWKVTARPTATQITLENPAPGNGSSSTDYADAGESTCAYPIVSVSSSDECDDAAVTEAVLIGCTSSGKKKLTSDIDCGLVVFDNDKKSFSVKALLGGSSTSGPHYIEWDADDPCNSTLVSSPDLLGADCTTLDCCFNLSPKDDDETVEKSYIINVADATLFTASAPNNIFELASKEYTVLEVVESAVPGKLKVRPRFEVTTATEVPINSQICLQDGCQAFPVSDYPLPCDIETYGEKVFCAEDGLRTIPRSHSRAYTTAFEQATEIAIKNNGDYDRDPIYIEVANPSPCYTAEVMFTVEQRDMLDVESDGRFRTKTMLDIKDAPSAPTTEYSMLRANSVGDSQNVHQQLVSVGSFQVPAGGTKYICVMPRQSTTNDSANASSWNSSVGKILYHLTTT